MHYIQWSKSNVDCNCQLRNARVNRPRSSFRDEIVRDVKHASSRALEYYICVYIYIYICIHTYIHTHSSGKLALNYEGVLFMHPAQLNTG